MGVKNFKEKLSREGFFKLYFDKLLPTVGEDVMNRFELLKKDEERFRFVCEVIIPGNKLEIEWAKTGKDREEAMKAKEIGNKEFARGNNEEALRLYTESLLKLPQDTGSTTDLAIILANRSASLYHMTEYESARKDIDVALTLDYPKDLRYKIHDRKARCLLAEQRHEEAIGEFRKTLSALDDSKLATDRKLKMQTDIQIMLGIMTKPKTKDGRVNALLPRKTTVKKIGQGPVLCSNRNKVYTSACDKVDILRGESVGRYAAAARDINAGEVLLIEKPYSSVLLQEFSHSHCLNCFKRTLAPYPCQTCSTVVFCSTDCRNKAVESYHKYECPVLATIYESGASVMVLMALRIVTQNSLQFFLGLKSVLSEEKEFKEYQSCDYEAIYHLVRHEKLRKREDLLERTVMSWFLLLCLRKSNYFPTGDSGGGTPTEEEYFISSLILRHLQLLQFNAHEIFEVEIKPKQKLEKARSVFIGGGIFATLSLFNHSCDPGIVRYFRGTEVVARAIKPIKQGELIAENYGPIFTETGRDERKVKLKSQYWFDCECIPCVENWPSFGEMDETILRFRCDSRTEGGKSGNCANVILVPQSANEFMVKCVSCGQHTNILKGLKILQDTDAMYRQASRDAEAGNYQSALGIYLEILDMLDSVMVPPFKDYHLCQQAIRTCMICLGNTVTKNN